MSKRIHILGASGSGTTTLGQALGEQLSYKVFDSDDYFWKHKFTEQREQNERAELLKRDLESCDNWVHSGAVCNWGDGIKRLFDLVIFLYVPSATRLQRLQEREFIRYGEDIMPGGSKHEQSQAFLEWAALYDQGDLNVRSRALHEQWMADLTCPILKIEGEHSVSERVSIVLTYLEKKQPREF